MSRFLTFQLSYGELFLAPGSAAGTVASIEPVSPVYATPGHPQSIIRTGEGRLYVVDGAPAELRARIDGLAWSPLASTAAETDAHPTATRPTLYQRARARLMAARVEQADAATRPERL